MHKNLYWCLNISLFLISFLADRITKGIILKKTFLNYSVNNYLHFDLIYNRGISWGIFNSENALIFAIVSTVVFSITLFLAMHIYQRIQQNKLVIGEVLVLSGALSNIVDRVVYKGVIDFIVVSYKQWSWPAFNIADFSIVVGCIIMLIISSYEEDKQQIIKL